MGVVEPARRPPEALRDALAAGAALGRRRRWSRSSSPEPTRTKTNHKETPCVRPAVARASPPRCSRCRRRSRRSPAAQAWPDKPIRIVVNFPPGGAADQIARLVGQPLQEALGQPVVIENRTGAGGNVAGDAVAKSAPDGYTLLMSSGGMVSVNPHIYAKMTFDPAKDLSPVAAAARVLGLPRRQAGVPGEQRPGVPRLREGEPRQAQLRHARQRQLAAPRRRDDEQPGRHVRRATCPTAAPRRR